MDEFKEGALRSGSKTGPVVTNPKQAVAILLSEKNKEGRGSVAIGGMKRGAKRSTKFAARGSKTI
jgi:hypothetical protein